MLLKRFHNRNFSRWMGPLIGLVVGAYCGIQNPFALGGLSQLTTIIGGAVLGGLAGILVMLLDPKPEQKNTQDQIRGFSEEVGGSSHLVGRVLACFSLLMCWMPFIGFGLSLIGYVVNRRSTDAAFWVASFSLLIAMTVTLVTLVLFALDG